MSTVKPRMAGLNGRGECIPVTLTSSLRSRGGGSGDSAVTNAVDYGARYHPRESRPTVAPHHSSVTPHHAKASLPAP